jgi:hypothetical protein
LVKIELLQNEVKIGAKTAILKHGDQNRNFLKLKRSKMQKKKISLHHQFNLIRKSVVVLSGSSLLFFEQRTLLM